MSKPLLQIVKIGGNIIDNEDALSTFVQQFAKMVGPKILVHGGGKLATQMAENLGIKQQMVDGRRITDSDTLDIVTMVYAGKINKHVVALLNSHGDKALGLSGCDANLIQSHKRHHPTLDYGYVGDIDKVNVDLIRLLLGAGLTLVIAPITHDNQGQLLNTNADTIAQALGTAMAAYYDISLIFAFDKDGVMTEVNDPASSIAQLDYEQYLSLKKVKVINEGMIPKIDNAFKAIESGVKKVIIGNALHISDIIAGKSGTTIGHG